MPIIVLVIQFRTGEGASDADYYTRWVAKPGFDGYASAAEWQAGRHYAIPGHFEAVCSGNVDLRAMRSLLTDR